MKKTLLLSALVASAATFAGTTGSVEGFTKTSTDFIKDNTHTEEISNSKLEYGSKFEVKVDNSGFSFGGTLHNTTAFNAFSDDLVNGYFKSDKSNLWVKYDLPVYKGVSSYVKGKLYAKPGKDFIMEFEGNAEKTINDATLTLNSKTKTPVKTPYIYTTTTKFSAKKDLAKVKELKGEVEVQHMFEFKDNKDDNMFTFKYINGNISGKYVDIKDTELKGELNLRYNHNNNSISNDYTENYDKIAKMSGIEAAFKFTKFVIDDFDFEDAISNLSKDGKFGLSAKIGAEYKGIKDTTITGGAQLIYNNFDKNNLITPVLRVGVEYKGVKNLTLAAKGILVKPILVDHKLGTTLTYLNVNGKYDYNATDKLTISPEFNAEAKSLFVKDNMRVHFIGLTPKVSAKYKANDNLVFEGNVSTTSYIVSAKAKNQGDSKYLGTTLRTGLNVKYTW